MMYQLMDGVNVWVVIYFILLVLIGAIIVMNLFLGTTPPPQTNTCQTDKSLTICWVIVLVNSW